MTGTGFVGKTAALCRKDLRLEMRSLDTLPPMVAFGVTVALVLAFTVPSGTTSGPGGGPTATIAYVEAGFLWITVVFASLIAFGRTFETERRDGALDALLLAPLDRSGLFAAKLGANLCYLVLLEAVMLPVFGLFFAFRPSVVFGPLVIVALLVDLGLAAVGTLLAAVAAQTRSRELLLPLLALPALVPVLISGVELTSDLVLGAGFGSIAARGWFVILVAFDVVATVAGALAFEAAID